MKAKSIRILTIHAMHNPGSVFQAYALEKYLKTRFSDVKIIDYEPTYMYNEGHAVKLLAKKILFYKQYHSRKKKFEFFIKQNMDLTARYQTYEELAAANIEADYFVVGSDQLWNSDFPCGNDVAFYLSFVNKGKKVSYATSVGKKEIDTHNEKLLADNLPSFAALSVREHSTSEYLSKILKRKVYWVADPVFLLNENDYQPFIRPQAMTDKKYAVVYLAPSSDTLDKVVDHYKKEGLFIILAGGMTKRCYCDKHIIDVGPLEFLTLIKYAEIVISDSFHATAFSHILHKSFVTLLPERNSERIESLLSVSGLENRMLKLGEHPDFDKIDLPVNWERTDDRLSKYIQDSQGYLDLALNS